MSAKQVHKLVGPTYGSLRQVAKPLTYNGIFSPETKQIVKDMRGEMHEQFGIGISGNKNHYLINDQF